MHFCPLCNCSALTPRVSKPKRTYFECECCGLISLDPSQRLDREAETTRYRLHENSSKDAGYREFLNQALRPLQERLHPGSRGLDYGCGPNPTTSIMLSEQGFIVDDYDPIFCPKEFSELKPYEFISCTETIEHMFNPAREFETMDRLLVPGGWLVFMTGIFYDTEPFETWWYARDPTHVSIYQPKTFVWMAGKFGWAMITMSESNTNVRLYQKLGA